MTDKINTYNTGYSLFFTRDITKGDMVNICNDITAKFNNQYIFEPEPITDGFIYIKNQRYKSIRLYGNFSPFVPENVMEKWKNNDEIFVSKTTEPKFNKFKVIRRNYLPPGVGYHNFGGGGKNYIETMLKSFGDASPWTIEELKIIKDVLANYDILTSNINKLKYLK